MNQHNTIGLDLAKTIFHLVELDPQGQFIRSQMLRFFAQCLPHVVAMEACASSHYWGRELSSLGHQVLLLPPQHVKAYLRGQKNDYNDARAIAEAAHHGALRPVPVKSIEQQDTQAFHRLRSQHLRRRTALCNQLRGLLGEYGIIIAQGLSALRRTLPLLLEPTESRVSERLRGLLQRQYDSLCRLDDDIAWYDAELQRQATEDPVCRALQRVPGFGPVVSSALQAWLGDGQQFARGRDASAALGVVPRQHSSGGKPLLLGISKRGDCYVRSLVIHGARAVVSRAAGKDDPLSRWILAVESRRGRNKATVALANKRVRIAWVIVARGETYRPSSV
jgi:transposase